MGAATPPKGRPTPKAPQNRPRPPKPEHVPSVAELRVAMLARKRKAARKAEAPMRNAFQGIIHPRSRWTLNEATRRRRGAMLVEAGQFDRADRGVTA